MIILEKTLTIIGLSRYFSKIARKSRKANSIIERHKEEKLMFGGVLETKKQKQIREKKQRKEGQPFSSVGTLAPDSEAYWLANLCSKDLKVYRKTSTGRYKEVEKLKIFESLKPLPKIDNDIKIKEETISMPDIIVRNITSAPMLANNVNKELKINDDNLLMYPSVTKILTETMSNTAKMVLERWKAKMIQQLGEEGFIQYNKEQLSLGSRFHSCVRSYLEGQDPEITTDLEPVWGSMQQVLPGLSDVRLLEKKVAHPQLKYKGVVDCVASYKNIPTVIEWKLSQKTKSVLSATYDAPLQLSAYMGALSYDTENRTCIGNGMIVVAYKDGAPADILPMDEQTCLRHWNLWLHRVQSYWRSLKNV